MKAAIAHDPPGTPNEWPGFRCELLTQGEESRSNARSMGIKWVGQVGVAVAVLSSWSCSGSPSDSGSGGAASGGTSTDASGGETAAGSGGDSDDGGGGTNSTGGANATGGTSGMGGTVFVAAPELYPLALGNSWTTNASDVIACEPAYTGQEVYATDEVGGRVAWVLSEYCFAPDFEADARMAVIDGEVAQWLNSQWQITLPEPVEAGYTWTVEVDAIVSEFRWVFAGEVTVPAGTFANCWRRENTAEVGAGTTYCPGVGPVRRVHDTGVVELTAYDVD